MFHFDDIVQPVHRNHYGRQFVIPVLTTAQGRGAERFVGFIDNTDLAKTLKDLVQ